MTAHPLHHVTAVAGNARRNLDVYTRVLGLRLVKKTVNFDDPSAYHFYYGDEAGAPGSILTFFPWEQAAPGRLGAGETQETLFRVPAGATEWWAQRLEDAGLDVCAPETRFGETILPFRDPDGMRLALVEVAGAGDEPAWAASDIPAEMAIRGMHGVRLLLRAVAPTAAILRDVFGFAETGRDGPVVRMEAVDGPYGSVIELVEAPGSMPARMGRGSVHHIAFRARDDAEQAAMAEALTRDHRMQVTDQRDRNYFRSVYFREPGGVLFEIATDAPGFAVDEPAEALGQALKLPAQYEKHRAEIERILPALG
ncbi:ring-cleaving dioxygenase [Albimonas sp. CAU 1670]|uniref:ring-cleaving dioxygenase n=1 Tax=Albimonas sp. CAU 1670 TaxID=3032599 RepID=UPI0023DBD242|nr:ring-cleaving dioxygenase [Albimonas sp. CAU 1670]MDF2232458.1 ring-cleaving dioxygenase [Albimonas sp. CAU 1670]